MDSDVYRKITEMSYSQHVSPEKLINHMLKEHLGTMSLRRRGFILVSKQTIRAITEQASEETMINAARNIGAQIKELGMLMSTEQAAKPTLTDRLNALRFVMGLNGFPIEIGTDPSDKKIRIIVRMEMGRKYSLYVGEAIKMVLEGFAETDGIEATDSSLYIECTKEEQRIRQ